MTTTIENMRGAQSAHPSARHTWARGTDTTEAEHFDEMPMGSDGEIYDPTERPRHAKKVNA